MHLRYLVVRASMHLNLDGQHNTASACNAMVGKTPTGLSEYSLERLRGNPDHVGLPSRKTLRYLIWPR